MCEFDAQVIVFTGDGKGKTTSALGIAVAAALEGRPAAVVQFLKGGGYTGELFAADYLRPYFHIRQFGYGCPIAQDIKAGVRKCSKCGLCFRENRNPSNGFAEKALAYAHELVAETKTEVLVLDEISHALKHKLIAEDAVLDLIHAKPAGMTMILTGRNMPERVQALAQQVWVLSAVKHPMTKGINARRGIEY